MLVGQGLLQVDIFSCPGMQAYGRRKDQHAAFPAFRTAACLCGIAWMPLHSQLDLLFRPGVNQLCASAAGRNMACRPSVPISGEMRRYRLELAAVVELVMPSRPRSKGSTTMAEDHIWCGELSGSGS